MVVETWRIVAASLMAVGGFILALVAMAQTRDRRGRDQLDVLRTGAIALGILAVITLLVATVLPSTVSWGLVAASWIMVGVVTLAD
ncbi:hypothetical protein GCM10012275_40340 [Longimycelium tulufanense]|uniref:Uncharacterized protein n=1 Tax=Longimycelium tulufanense TaxID=907463 RepID=A0A8J3FV77_9PSEU|nr:hypothetical protein GCM10012275_40340 [Longimycelium tulufanense]